MAEISYPFNADNSDGGRAIVSQTQWQSMAHMWGGDRIDYTLTASAYDAGDLPFSGRIINGRSVEIKPGKAWVGGFYYQLTAAKSVTIEANPGTKARKDIVVIQADMASSSVNLAVVKGTATSSPVAPQPRRVVGGLWEMVLFEVDVAALDASVTIDSRLSFNAPAPIASPWNTRGTAGNLPRGTLVYDMDVNNTDTQYEAFNGRDGYVVTRDFGRTRTYTPELINVNQPAIREGRYRYIAPNMIWFSIHLQNTSGSELKLHPGNWTFGTTLPVPANGRTGQLFTAFMDNNTEPNATNMPNFVQLLGKVNRGGNTSVIAFYQGSKWSADEGMDGVDFFPRRSYITVSGVYEAALVTD
ncbi:hypothetical protein [Streptomyces sp. H27-H5]|uniref:hypothetical protein n=1 Tax=Streptomyces sp. H27-H5 TaxID=2996460 RepID=UPI002271A8F5|nr:hypothetical protein [Streptomyces sp. H27-H5]MCY0962730.1 hypothetical protein [Streptomyces sp. H27-H5]